MDKKLTNEHTELHQFRKDTSLAMMVIYLPVKFEFDWKNHFRIRVRKRKMWMDRRKLDTSI